MKKERNMKRNKRLLVKADFTHVNIHWIVLIIIAQMKVYIML